MLGKPTILGNNHVVLIFLYPRVSPHPPPWNLGFFRLFGLDVAGILPPFFGDFSSRKLHSNVPGFQPFFEGGEDVKPP